MQRDSRTRVSHASRPSHAQPAPVSKAGATALLVVALPVLVAFPALPLVVVGGVIALTVLLAVGFAGTAAVLALVVGLGELRKRFTLPDLRSVRPRNRGKAESTETPVSR